MKFAVLACLLVVAGASAFSQDDDVVPSQERVADLWLQNVIEKLRRLIEDRGFAPLEIKEYKIDYVFIDGLVELIGKVVDLEIKGLNHIFLNSVNFNIILGRLDWDIVMPKVSISVGKLEVEGRYGDRGGKVKVSGSLVISNSRLRGNALLRLDPGPKVHLYNINVDSGIDNFEADLKVNWQCRGCHKPEDLSEDANEFLNNTLNELLLSYKPEIDTIIAEIIRYLVNWYW